MAVGGDVGVDLGNAFAGGVIDEDDYLLLADVADVQYVGAAGGVGHGGYRARWGDFDFDLWSDQECWVDCRFRKADVLRICGMLGLGDEVILPRPDYIHCSTVELFCLVCRRLAFPCRYVDLLPKFGRSLPYLCKMFNFMLSHLYNRYYWLLRSFEQPWLSGRNLSYFAERINTKGAPLDNCWGFVDGTVRGIARPQQDQRLFYNGHKRKHALKYQAVNAPNGLIANFYGPIEGARHDSYLLRQSGLLGDLQRYSFGENGQLLCIYGDGGYPFSAHLQTGHRDPANAAQQQYNARMSSCRVTVEWAFGMVIEKFKFTDHKAMQKSGLSPLAKQYAVSAILSNMSTCLYGNNTTNYFECQPPTLAEYLLPQPAQQQPVQQQQQQPAAGDDDDDDDEDDDE